MDVSRYDFGCQKALHHGLQYAKSMGTSTLEVEQVALALIKAGFLLSQNIDAEGLRKHLEAHLAARPRVFGVARIQFGSRLDVALDMAEAKAGSGRVSESLLWEMLCRQSTVIQLFLGRGAEAHSVSFQGGAIKTQDFMNMKGFKAAGDGVVNSVQEPSQTEKAPNQTDQFLRQYTLDLTARAQRGELDPVIGRDDEVRRVLEVLGRKKKNNPLLLGEPGVGKSAIAEALALRIAGGAVPESMLGKRVLSLDLGSLLAGARYRGEFEDRLRKLLGALTELNGKIILFIDEIHMIIGAGNQEGGADAANLMKPALARGELQCLGATTLDEYRKHIERDAALERRFQPIQVFEPTRQEALLILHGLKGSYEVHHSVQIEDAALISAVDMSIRYLPTRKLPDKAIDLIDEAASKLRLAVETVPGNLSEMRAEIEKIEIERKGLVTVGRFSTLELEERLRKLKSEYEVIDRVWHDHQERLAKLKDLEKRRQEAQGLFEAAKLQGDFTFAARVQYDEIPRVEKEIGACKELLEKAEQKYDFLRQVVGSADVAAVISAWTGIPVGRLLESEVKRLLQMEKRLGSRVFGQEQALARVSKAVRRSRAGLSDPQRPIGIFMFLGPTGVGKTETARALAEELFDDQSKLIRIDMSEYMEAHSVARLTGAPPGYVGYEEGSGLIDLIRHKPYSVVLFDEVEKAHPRVLDILLALLEDGRLTDGRGRIGDFRHALIILTSNIPLGAEEDSVAASDRDVREALSSHMRPELVNRIAEIVVFKPLGSRHLMALLERLVAGLNDRLAERKFRVCIGLQLAIDLIVTVEGGSFGGRALRRLFEEQIINAVAERIMVCPALAVGAWVLDRDGDGSFVWRFEHRASYYLTAS
jgi:ATP-dependent Clp protease ATP-binding subunit ClpB